MTTRYEKSAVVPRLAGLHGVARIRAAVLAKVPIKREIAQIRTGDRKIEETSLADAFAAVEPGDRLRGIHVALFTCRADELAVAITYAAPRHPLRRRRGVSVQVRGTDEVAVLGLIACLQRLRGDPHRRGTRRRLEALANSQPDEHRSLTPSRTWWWSNITVGAVAQVIAAALLALGSVLWWALIQLR